MALDYRMQGQFPMAEVIRAAQQQPLLQQEIAASRQKQLQDALSSAGEGIGAMAEARRRMAAAMTMAQNPGVQQAMGAGQVIPGTGSINAPAGQQMTTAPDGSPVTPGMTAQGGSGMSPIPNTPMKQQPPMSPQQIAALLPDQKGSPDYMGDIQKMGNLSRLQQMFQAKGNVVTPIVGQDGQISYGTTQVQPGSTVQRPVQMHQPPRPPAPGRPPPAGANPINQALTLRKQLMSARSAIFDPNDPRGQALDNQISAIDERMGAGNSYMQGGGQGQGQTIGGDGAMRHGVQSNSGGLPPPPQGRVYIRDKNGSLHTVPQEQLNGAISAGYTQI